MGELGICLNIKGLGEGLWSVQDLRDLGVVNGWIRTPVQGSLSMLDTLNSLPPTLKVLVTLNNECDEVKSDWSGWEGAIGTLVEQFGNRVNAVACGNELDLHGDVPPSFSANLVKLAHPILKAAGIPTIATSVTGPNWISYLEELVDECGSNQPDFYDAHFYGKGFAGLPQAPSFGTVADGIATALSLTRGRPLVLSEAGVKIGEINGEAGQATYVRRWVETVRGMTASRVAVGTFFALYDEVGGPAERGPAAFGLISEVGDGRRKRPAFNAYRDAAA